MDVGLDQGLADESSAEELPEGEEQVAAREAREVEQRIGNRRHEQHAHEPNLLHRLQNVLLGPPGKRLRDSIL